jgi:hypothetical protein
MDKPFPYHRTLSAYFLRTEGTYPRTRHIVTFDYEDGSQREFDGATWTVTRTRLRNGERTPVGTRAGTPANA